MKTKLCVYISSQLLLINIYESVFTITFVYLSVYRGCGELSMHEDGFTCSLHPQQQVGLHPYRLVKQVSQSVSIRDMVGCKDYRTFVSRLNTYTYIPTLTLLVYTHIHTGQ